jgi:putative membrane protein
MTKLRMFVSAMIATGVAFVLSAGVALADRDGHMWNAHEDAWGRDGWGILMLVTMVLFWAAVVAVAVWVVRHFTRSRGMDKSPLDIAKERLAKGEISDEEFERLKQKLS